MYEHLTQPAATIAAALIAAKPELQDTSKVRALFVEVFHQLVEAEKELRGPGIPVPGLPGRFVKVETPSR